MLLFCICASLATLGITGYLFQMAAVLSLTSPCVSGDAAELSPALPQVSILKPLKGLDDGLFDNLESFCNLDYPRYEIIFSLQNRNDPAHKVVRKIKEKYPSKDITIVVEHCDDGLNPKVNNLISSYKRAKYDHILISDSNIRADKGYLKAIAGHMADPEVGLVTNMIRGVNGRSAGAVLENLHLNSFIVGSVCFLDKYLGIPCVIGKSMLMRKADLDAIGGFSGVKDLLAEDYIIGERIHRMGKKVVLSSHIINNVNEYWGIGRFLNRHTRWGKLRWKIGGITYISELLANAVFISVIPLVFLPLTKLSLLLAGGTSVVKISRDFYLGERVKAGMHPLLYLFSPLKDLLIGLIWFVPLMSNIVAWRGNRYVIGKDSLLTLCPETAGRHWMPGIVALIKTRFAPSKS